MTVPVTATPAEYMQREQPARDDTSYDPRTFGGVVRALRADLRHWELVHGATLGPLRKLLMLAMPCMLAVVLYRSARFWYLHRWYRLARLCWILQQVLTKADLAPWADIGPGLMLGHSVCTVVSGGRIGRNVILFGYTIVGGRDAQGREPDIGDGVTLGWGVMVFGGVTVGNGAFVGMNAMVLDDVAPSGVVIGRPARALMQRTPVAVPA